MTTDELERLALSRKLMKVSPRDFGAAVASRATGGTTVAATMIAAHAGGIRVCATGGIGGVHRGDAGDVSHDLPVLARTPIAVVSAGAKAILDLPRTLETLETLGVLTIGYRTSELPAFYSRGSGPRSITAPTPPPSSPRSRTAAGTISAAAASWSRPRSPPPPRSTASTPRS